MSNTTQQDPHERPPFQLRPLFKKYQKCTNEELEIEPDVIDPRRPSHTLSPQLMPAASASFADREAAFRNFLATSTDNIDSEPFAPTSAFEVVNIPGLYILPCLIPPQIQITLLNRLLHRDLSNSRHRTNVHLHHEIHYPEDQLPTSASSFFSQNSAILFPPRDPDVHKQITVADFLKRRLRWMTLGGQYNWTAKRYPQESPPVFPTDVKLLLKCLFPATDAQAAIVNFYSPGDTLSLHRDVSEYCDQGLVSISLGCDGLFVVGNQHNLETATLRLRSGDALYMTGLSRYAWHGVPKVVPNTCPDWLAEWPAVDSSTQYNEWRGWMGSKRINLNVRQITQIS